MLDSMVSSSFNGQFDSLDLFGAYKNITKIKLCPEATNSQVLILISVLISTIFKAIGQHRTVVFFTFDKSLLFFFMKSSVMQGCL